LPILSRFMDLWVESAQFLLKTRFAASLHLMSIAVCLGVLASFTSAAIVDELRLGWKTTIVADWFAYGVVSVGYAPIKLIHAVFGYEFITFDELKALKGFNGHRDGLVIRWYWSTVALLLIGVIIPRALLAWSARNQARSLSAQLTVDLSDLYFRKLRVASSNPRIASIQIEPDASVQSTGSSWWKPWTWWRS
jgi:hypothetical protein